MSGPDGLGGFHWGNVGEVLRNWHGVETSGELQDKLRICENEVGRIDSDRRKRREKERKAKSRSGGRRARRR